MLRVRTYPVGASATVIFDGAPEAPPPNRLMGRSNVLIRVREGGAIFVGGDDVSPTAGVRLGAGAALSVAPVGPTDIIYAIAENIDATVEVLEQGMFL